MGRIVAIAGGDLETTKALNLYALSMCGKGNKTVLFLGTASGDDPEYISIFRAVYKEMGCRVRTLKLTKKTYSTGAIRREVSMADLIYVGGGDTVFMMNVWKKTGMDVIIKEAYNTDSAVLTGISAGAICWFDSGCTDSESAERPLADNGVPLPYGIADGMLGFHHYVFCPHYGERTAEFEIIRKMRDKDAIALENNTAFVEGGGKIYFISSNAEAKGYVFSDGMKKEIEMRFML